MSLADFVKEPNSHKLPQKRYYRQRAHSNPIADHSFEYPAHPDEYDWTKLYPNIGDNRVEIADVGCGYGGFLVRLGELFPEKFSIGFEIRVKVSDYVMDRIDALRKLHPNQYQNIACLRTNAMKYLPNFFKKGQLSKICFLYSDPHFKKSKHKWRIISSALLTEYAYVLREGGIIYTITDVEDLHQWMVKHLDEHSLFERILGDELESDPVVEKLYATSEEGQKVTRNNGSKFVAIYRRLSPKPLN